MQWSMRAVENTRRLCKLTSMIGHLGITLSLLTSLLQQSSQVEAFDKGLPGKANY